jgi:hypothetical protein
LQHPTSHPTTNSWQTTIVNASKKNFAPHPAGKYGKSANQSPQLRHQLNEGKSSWEVETVRGLVALYSLQSKKKLLREKQGETHFLSNNEKKKWIEDYVARGTTAVRK